MLPDKNNVTVFDTASDNVTATIQVESYTSGVAASPDGTRVYIAKSDGIYVIDTTTNKVIATISVELSEPHEEIMNIAASGTKVYTATNHNHVYVIDTARNNVIANINLNRGHNETAMLPDGTNMTVNAWDRSDPGRNKGIRRYPP